MHRQLLGKISTTGNGLATEVDKIFSPWNDGALDRCEGWERDITHRGCQIQGSVRWSQWLEPGLVFISLCDHVGLQNKSLKVCYSMFCSWITIEVLSSIMVIELKQQSVFLSISIINHWITDLQTLCSANPTWSHRLMKYQPRFQPLWSPDTALNLTTSVCNVPFPPFTSISAPSFQGLKIYQLSGQSIASCWYLTRSCLCIQVSDLPLDLTMFYLQW